MMSVMEIGSTNSNTLKQVRATLIDDAKIIFLQHFELNLKWFYSPSVKANYSLAGNYSVALSSNKLTESEMDTNWSTAVRLLRLSAEKRGKLESNQNK